MSQKQVMLYNTVKHLESKKDKQQNYLAQTWIEHYMASFTVTTATTIISQGISILIPGIETLN